MKINITLLVYLPIIFMFLPAFAIWIPGLNGAYLIYFLFLYLALIILFFKHREKMIIDLYNICKVTPLRYFVITLLLIVFDCILLSIFKIMPVYQAIRSIFLKIILCILPIIFYYTYIIKNYIKLERFINIFIMLFWINLVLGLISWFGALFDIAIINNCFDFLTNSRILQFSNNSYDNYFQVSNYYAFGLPRLDNLFEEPSWYARFLFIFLPFVYSFGATKLKICKNKILNVVIKQTLIPFTWLNIILTFSPIYLILCILITVIYYFNKLILIIKHYGLLLLCFLSILLLILNSIDLSDTYLSRILNVLSNLNSFEQFSLIEPSLATRIIGYINSICVFVHYPLTGVGLGNLHTYIYHQMFYSPVVLTPEIITKLQIATYSSNAFSYNGAFLYAMLAECGIVVTISCLYFFYRLYKAILICAKLYKNDVYFLTAYSLKISFIGLFITFLYGSSLILTELYFIVSITIMFLYYTKNELYKMNTKKRQNDE